MSKRIGKALFAVAACALVVLSTGWNAGAHSGRQHEIVGTWAVTVQLVSCNATPLPSIPPPFKSLLTFNDGETMIEDTTNPSFAAGQRGTGHGVWEYAGWHSYAVKSVAFINFSTTPPAPAPPLTAGTQTITQTIDFDNGPDKWTATAQIQFADASGTVYRSGCATATAVRFE